MEFNRCLGCMEEKHQHPICEHCGYDERTGNDVHQLPVGTILRGQYLIGRVLGQGGFGITYLAWDLNLDMPVAIKEFYPSGIVTRDTSTRTEVRSFTGPASQNYEESKKRFLREGKALAKFQSLENIVRIHSLIPENNTAYLVMEYLKGRTLQQYIDAHGPISLNDTLSLLGPLAEDLQTIHNTGIIHRDISPDNIMVLEDGRAKLLDFGTVRQVENPDQNGVLSKSTEAILKQGFAPIEQYNTRGTLGPWTDVYALCATICYCLNGKIPQIAPDRVYADEPEHFINILPIGEAQKQILKKGMALRPADRSVSVSQLFRQLQETAQTTSVQKAPNAGPEVPSSHSRAMHAGRKNRKISGKPPKAAPARKRRWPIFVSIGCVLLAVMTALIWVRSSGMIEKPPFSEAEVSLSAPADPSDLVLRNADPLGETMYAFGTLVRKDNIVSIDFLDSLDSAPVDAEDISESGNKKVLLWAEAVEGGLQKVFIAGDGKVIFPKNSSYLFGGLREKTPSYSYHNLESFRTNQAIDTSGVFDMRSMFEKCSSLQTLDLSDFDTAQVTNMASMFYRCENLITLNISGLKTGNVISMNNMFSSCNRLEALDLHNFDTSQVQDMGMMFWNCVSLRALDVSSFNTAQVLSMSSMFSNCSNVRFLDLSGFDTSSVTLMNSMFASCSSLQTLDLSGFDTAQVRSMSWMFYRCSNLQVLDLSSFNTSKVENMSRMFNFCVKLTHLDLSGFDTALVSDMSAMFQNCGKYLNVITDSWALRSQLKKDS